MVPSINFSAVLKAAGIGLLVTLLFTACGFALNAAVGIAPGSVPRPEDIPPGYLLFSTGLSCVSYLLYVAYGALYGWFARRGGAALTGGQGALGGAVTGVLLFVGQSIVSGVFLALRGQAMFAQMQEQIQRQLEAQGTAGAFTPEMFTSMMLIGVVVGLCFTLILSGGLSAVGGAIYAAIAKSRPQPAAGEPAPGI